MNLCSDCAENVVAITTKVEKKQTWAYRVVHRFGIHNGGRWDGFDVREVYYEDGKPYMITEDAISPYGASQEEFDKSLRMYLQDIKKPILNYDWDKGEFV